MNFGHFIQKLFLKEPDKNNEFAKYLNKELLQSELLRSNILIGMFSVLALAAVILPILDFHVIYKFIDADKLFLLFLVFYSGIAFYEFFIRYLLKKAYQTDKEISNKIRYGNAFEEASIPTIGILVIAQMIDPIAVLLGPGSFLYFIFIALSALRLNFQLSAFTGLVAAVEYGLVTKYFLSISSHSESLAFYMQGSVYPKCFILFITGVIMGIVTLEIKKRIRVSYQFLKGQNKVLEEKVKQRTQELEGLNLELKKRVSDEVEKSREKEQLLVQQSKMSAMGEMISMIAHQWRQPLSSIGAVAGNLKVRYELDTLEENEFNQAIEDINHQTQYLSSTISDFRKFLSPTKNQEMVYFGDIVENALRIIGMSLQNKAITLKKEYNFQEKLMTFPNELMQVIINILKNSQDALLERNIVQPEIKLSGQETERYLEFMIDDNGGGIPEDILQHIFEPYFTTKSKTDGTGLGLYMSKTIIERHCQGKLSVENRDKGVRFIIELPLQTN